MVSLELVDWRSRLIICEVKIYLGITWRLYWNSI